MMEPSYLWLCDKCFMDFYQNKNLVTKHISPYRGKHRCDKCGKDVVCQGCKITIMEDEKKNG